MSGIKNSWNDSRSVSRFMCEHTLLQASEQKPVNTKKRKKKQVYVELKRAAAEIHNTINCEKLSTTEIHFIQCLKVEIPHIRGEFGGLLCSGVVKPISQYIRGTWSQQWVFSQSLSALFIFIYYILYITYLLCQSFCNTRTTSSDINSLWHLPRPPLLS